MLLTTLGLAILGCLPQIFTLVYGHVVSLFPDGFQGLPLHASPAGTGIDGTTWILDGATGIISYTLTLIEDAAGIKEIAIIPAASLTVIAACVATSTDSILCLEDFQDPTLTTTFTETLPFSLIAVPTGTFPPSAVPTTGATPQLSSFSSATGPLNTQGQVTVSTLPAQITPPPNRTTISPAPTTSSNLGQSGTPRLLVPAGTVLGFVFIGIAAGLMS
ncbi:hypothetical protein BD410DRAFT_302969 [Rickenella mellea]|uniref:Uncharacterized protein n=1 Tax=Rickenella mellea TaxID=50990 RepID=A0A4Y7Q3D3_9AGAM|nr:hypothetical protein BD410DRAFT_302969 [Rickenella mellea]